ncbi:MAG TPA: phosphoketolase family protein, partial [Zeimonas sp.]
MSGTARIDADVLRRIDLWWRAANYLSVGQIYLRDNPLLAQPLAGEHVKPRLLGHWGTTPGLNFVYAHLNRLIRDHDVDMIWIVGPGHGGPAAVANTWLEGSYSERYPDVTRDGEGMRRLFRQFSWPYGIPSHVAAEVPGSIHEGGELGYSLAHAWGAAFDNPDLVVACVIGDGEAETAALATSWHSNKFVDPGRDGAVLPILHLNGWKIANPTVLARIGDGALGELLRGYGYEPHFVCGDDPQEMHQRMAATLEVVHSRIRQIQRDAREARVPSAERAAGARSVPSGTGRFAPPRWPMIVLQSPKGWTGPDRVDGERVEGTWRAHQVPFGAFDKPGHLQLLEQWMRSYRPHELFDGDGRPVDDIVSLAPAGARRMGMNPHANGGERLVALELPDFREYALAVPRPGAERHESTRVLGRFLRAVFERNEAHSNFRLFGPDETASNRLDAVYEATDKAWVAHTIDADEHLAPDGRVMEVLSEHLLQGWLEGYLLTGRHGLFSSYEAFIHIVDSMLNQHAKWLKVTRGIDWRVPIASLNYLLTSHAWRQDHNGFSHQDPGFLDHVANKKADIARIYLPPDANCLLSVADHCLRSRDYVNVIVAGKQPEWQWLDIDAAVR